MKKSLLILLTVVVAVCSSLSLGAQAKKASPGALSKKASPIALLQRFYTSYIRSIDRMLEYDQRDSIVATALTPEMHVKLHRLRVASGMDPLLRQQDARAGLEKTFRARQLKGNWYEVSLGEPSELVRIPLHLTQVRGRYMIDFITPPWLGEAYGDHLMANPLSSSTTVDNSSEVAFIRSFYQCYLSTYLSMSPDLDAILAQLRERYCTQETLRIYRESNEFGNIEDGYYDVLIDYVDFDPAWVPSLQVRPQTEGTYEVSYSQQTEEGPVLRKILVRAVKVPKLGYRLQLVPEEQPQEVTPIKAPEEVTPQPQPLTEKEAQLMRQEYGDH